MNGYLVVVRMNLDDLPIRLFSSEEEANDFIDENIVDGEPTDDFQRRIETATEAIDFDTSDLVRCDVLLFVDGHPAGVVRTAMFNFVEE